MPELPEVENTRRYLIKAGLPGSTFTRADVGWPKALKAPALEDFVLDLMGTKVQEVNRLGKYLLLPLSGCTACRAPTLILHLGMTGGLCIEPASQPAHAMVRHTFGLDGNRELRFIDGRKFAKMWLVDDPQDVLPTLGTDPLGEDFTPETLTKALTGRNAPVKALLLEQSIVAGMGNLYADESLYLARIRPSRPADKLSKREISNLTGTIKTAFNTALAAYDEARDEQWPDPPMGMHTWSIPRKDGAPCPSCSGPISGTRIRARGTYFCRRCQR
jgi:formamidopyrimidine-DNA glycosylase